jgi:hypothetical protein
LLWKFGVADSGNIVWARSLRAQLVSDIQLLGARAREGGAKPEELGLLPYRDRLTALQKRLAQVERLIDAMAAEAHDEGWPADFGDPSEEAHPALADLTDHSGKQDRKPANS